MSEPPSVRPTIRWQATAHDQSQLEVVFDYSVVHDPAHGPRPWGPRPCFAVDLYLIAPPALVVTPDTLSKDAFFAETTQRMRLQTPDVPHFAAGELPAMQRYLDLGLDLVARRAMGPRVVQEVKLFANWVSVGLRDVMRADRRPEDLARLVSVVDAFRRHHRDRMRSQGLSVDDEVRVAVDQVDEYLSMRFEQVLSRATLARDSGASRALADRSASAPPIWIPHGWTTAEVRDLEGRNHRRGALKKSVSQILYLDPRPVSRNRLYRNLAAAGGAGLAALFAETARYYNTVASGTADFGFRVAVFIGIAVVAYVFKDRLKDLSKEYFGKKVAGGLPDRDTRLELTYVDPRLQQRITQVAAHHEWIHHTHVGSVPDDIRYVSQRMAADPDPDPGSDVLHYAKRVWIEPGALQTLEYDGLSVKEVLRISTTRFLSHLDDPYEELALFDEVDGAVVLQAPKVYHLDVILRMAVGPDPDDPLQIGVDGFRAVLDKQGIVRLDRPIERGRYRWGIAS